MRGLLRTLRSNETALGLGLIILLSYFTIVHNFWVPQSFFWDENYHVASAQKYLTGTFFMEPHPPLGKLLIAWGEKITNLNASDSQFISTDYAKNPPQGFQFAGYRLFPVLLAWWTAPVLFGIFLLLTKRPAWALLLSFLYVFDNALIVHLRGAMLEGPLLFFSTLTILAFLLVREHQDDDAGFAKYSLFFGLAFAGVMTTKLFGMVLVLLAPLLLILLWPDWRKFGRFAGYAALGFFPVYILVWQIHFSLAGRINPALPDAGYYQASPQYKQILTTHRNGSLLAFPVMLRDSLKFVGHYEKGVPRLDMCKTDENGSPWFLWPFGGRAINYRWETPNGQAYRYLYLQINPVAWASGLLGVALAASFLASSLFLAKEEHEERLEHGQTLFVFLVLYASFLFAVSRIDRVMYLYHYFLPLLLSFILFAVTFLQLGTFGRLRLTEERKTGALLCLGLLVFLSYQFYRPLTYYEPITDAQMKHRSLLSVWELHCVRCERDSSLVILPSNPGP